MINKRPSVRVSRWKRLISGSFHIYFWFAKALNIPSEYHDIEKEVDRTALTHTPFFLKVYFYIRLHQHIKRCTANLIRKPFCISGCSFVVIMNPILIIYYGIDLHLLVLQNSYDKINDHFFLHFCKISFIKWCWHRKRPPIDSFIPFNHLT